MPRPPPRRFVEDVASSRMNRLFNLAEQAFPQDDALAQRYVDLALKIGMRCRIRLTQAQRRAICHSCKAYLQPGVNSRIRTRTTREPHLAITCLKCGAITRIPLRPLAVKLSA